jgi:hypothetical protein
MARIAREMNERGWLYLTILYAISAVMLVWLNWTPVDARSGVDCRARALCLAMVDVDA